MKANYKSTLFALYFNYILQGMAIIILLQNVDPLMAQLNTNRLGISSAISFIGVGRVLSILFAGRISDRLGRKYTILIGMLCYIVFYGGLLVIDSLQALMFITVFAGFGNAFLDTGTYPALQETFPDAASSSSVLNKAFISTGQFTLPFITSFLLNNNLPYYYAFILCAALLTLNLLFVYTRSFKKANIQQESVPKEDCVNANFKIEGLALIFFAFTSAATFNIISLWLPEYASSLSEMSKTSSLMLVSVYSLGSFISVFITAYLIKKIYKPTLFLLLGTLSSLIALIFLVLYPTSTVCYIVAFSIGLFAAGGIWQIGLSKLLSWFSYRRGKVTSYYSLLASLSLMVIPTVTGYLADANIRYVMYFDVFITAISLILTSIIYYRNNKLVKMGCEA